MQLVGLHILIVFMVLNVYPPLQELQVIYNYVASPYVQEAQLSIQSEQLTHKPSEY